MWGGDIRSMAGKILMGIQYEFVCVPVPVPVPMGAREKSIQFHNEFTLGKYDRELLFVFFFCFRSSSIQAVFTHSFVCAASTM